MSTSSPLTRRGVFEQAWPIIVGQALVPTVGLVDTLIIGRTGNPTALAGVALGATVVTLVFWSFGFLRMGITGLAAQAQGAGDVREVLALLIRGLAMGAGIGIGLTLLHSLFLPSIFDLLAAPPRLEEQARIFTAARMYGAPGALGAFAINGWLIGIGRTRAALAIQIVMNGVNILLDVALVWGLGLGALGVGIGTATAEWCALLYGLVICMAVIGPDWRARLGGLDRAMLWGRAAMARLFTINAGLMVRTLALLGLFTWFTHAGARLGAVTLAANHVLMQFVSLSAFVLDGFAFTAESRVGAAIGARSRTDFLRAIRLTGEYCMGFGLVFALSILFGGGALINLITTDPATRAQAIAMLPFAAAIPLLGAPSWLLDGVFVGATQGRAMRDAAVGVTLVYLATDWLLRPYGNVGVWSALLASYGYRACALLLFWPALMRRSGLATPFSEDKAANRL